MTRGVGFSGKKSRTSSLDGGGVVGCPTDASAAAESASKTVD
jgi:hypothetical protein